MSDVEKYLTRFLNYNGDGENAEGSAHNCAANDVGQVMQAHHDPAKSNTDANAKPQDGPTRGTPCTQNGCRKKSGRGVPALER